MHRIQRSKLGITYQRAQRPRISADEADALEAGGRACLAIRPDTLGYQRCWRIDHHDGPHLSQDGQAWRDISSPAPKTNQS
ncbi:hypothetical protein [Mycobacteroides abscessus]|uniref:hypothetical protein n=1 Tax=Mycobacteroides abscessus TaxID=36809 RepID=UPI0009A72A8D|nr:hypothetical protein [Mycobacteroides abscessus]